MRSLVRFLRNEDGQDLTEYTLGVAFVALLCAAIFVSAGASTNGIWGQASNTLSGANTTVNGPPADDGGGHGGDGHGGDGHGGDGHGG